MKSVESQREREREKRMAWPERSRIKKRAFSLIGSRSLSFRSECTCTVKKLKLWQIISAGGNYKFRRISSTISICHIEYKQWKIFYIT